MSVQKLKPTTQGRRFRVVNNHDMLTLTKSKPEKSFMNVRKRSGGRNHRGKMTVRNIGGGHKRRYRVIDFKRDTNDVSAEILSIEYDPNRSAFIALVEYEGGEKKYVIAQNGMKVGQKIMSSD